MTDAIEVKSLVVKVSGDEITIQPLRVGQVPAFGRAIKSILPNLEKLDTTEGILDLVADQGEDLIQAVSVATGMPVNAVQQIEIDEFIELVAAIVEVNADFFTRRLAPKIQSAIAQMTNAVSGSTRSKN